MWECMEMQACNLTNDAFWLNRTLESNNAQMANNRRLTDCCWRLGESMGVGVDWRKVSSLAAALIKKLPAKMYSYFCPPVIANVCPTRGRGQRRWTERPTPSKATHRSCQSMEFCRFCGALAKLSIRLCQHSMALHPLLRAKSQARAQNTFSFPIAVALAGPLALALSLALSLPLSLSPSLPLSLVFSCIRVHIPFN